MHIAIQDNDEEDSDLENEESEASNHQLGVINSSKKLEKDLLSDNNEDEERHGL